MPPKPLRPRKRAAERKLIAGSPHVRARCTRCGGMVWTREGPYLDLRRFACEGCTGLLARGDPPGVLTQDGFSAKRRRGRPASEYDGK